MADKSPGIYFNEIDNTDYINPKSVSGTTVAIIGYAKKGKIGVPTLITSYANFKKTFGPAVSGYYSGLAVRTILSAGGRVLFTRVADGTASKSNVIIKNGSAGFSGYTSFSSEVDIMPGNNKYSNSTVYGFKVNSNDTTKNFFVTSPNTGTLTRRAILKQIQEQLGETPATYYAKMNSSLNTGLYSFEISLDGEVAPGVEEQDRGFFIETNGNGEINTLKSAIQQRITNGTNAIAVLKISASANDSVVLDEEVPTKIKGLKKFNLVLDDAEHQIAIDFGEDDNGLTLKQIAGKIDSTIKNNYGVRCLSHYYDDGLSELIFVSMNNKSIDIHSIGQIETIVDPDADIKDSYDLFLAQEDKQVLNIAEHAESDINTKFFVNSKTIRGQSASRLSGILIDIDTSLNAIKFTTGAVGEGKQIAIVPTTYGKFIFDEVGNCGATKFGAINGQSAIDVDVSLKDGKKITFTSLTLEPPTIEKLMPTDFEENEIDPLKVKDLVDLLGVDEPVDGKVSVSAKNDDIIIISSKEEGSATDNIRIEVFTTTSPIPNEDGTYPVRHDLTVTVDGILVETYSNISLNFEDVDNRFDTIINEDPENGGSNYINILIEKNNFSNPEVNLPDGIYYVGKGSSDASIAYNESMEVSDYINYDYKVGTDGIPTDGGDDLFEKAMEPNVAPLSNIEMYDFHILITPDNISETVQAAAIALCEFREDAMYIADPPLGLTRDGVVNWHNGRGYGRMVPLNSNYVATYWPWCKIQDSTTSKFTWVMPSVLMAAKYVEVDRTQGAWYAPAGDIRGVLGAADIEAYPNANDRDILYVDYNRVNPICKMQTGEIIVYGEKTCQRTNSVLTKVHTRRMLIQIKKQCRAALKGYIFEPNTANYLANVKSDVSAILEGYKTGGGISAYRVICDETNNPTEVRQQDIINVDIAIVPEGTIEQINITLSLNKTLNSETK